MVLQQTASTKLNKRNNITNISLPGPRERNFGGMSLFFSKRLHLELHQLAKQYGNVFQVRVGNKKLVVLNGLETVKEALLKQHESFNARANFEMYQQSPQRYFIETKSGELWKKHRSIVSQVMHTFLVNKSDDLESWVLEDAADLTKIFLNSEGKPFDPDPYLPLATLSFMQRLLFNKRGTFEDREEDNSFVATARHLNQLGKILDALKLEFIPKILQPIFVVSRWKTFRSFLKILNELQSYISKNVEEHRESFQDENLRDITDRLLKATNELTESDRNLGLSENDIVKGSLIQFLGAGTSFPTILVSWTLLYMINYPDIQAAIQQELDEVIGREKQPTFKDRSQLPLTEACINEIFRHSSATNLPPISYGTSTDTILNDYFIPQKTPVIVNYYSLTRDERYWQEPEQFNPYRFIDENGKLRKNLLDKFYPFGVGPRRCMGEYLGRLLIFTLFTNLMHRCKFDKVPGEKSSLEPKPGNFVIPQDFKVIVKPRF